VLVIFGYRTLDADLSGGHAWMQDLTKDLPLIEALMMMQFSGFRN
jgi:hypothetical protein